MGFLPNFQYSKGVNKVSNKVELIRPEKITIATGWSISLPGSSAAHNKGMSANAVTIEVISTGDKRSFAPRIIKALSNDSPSKRIKFR